MKAIINKEQVTTIFQNSERFRAGKLHKKHQADMAVRWLLEVFLDLHEVGKSVKIVPLVTNYDRIYEADNLATEMINGKKQNYNIFSSLREIHTTKENSLGHIYVKYLEPIDLEQFLGNDVRGRLN